MSRGRAVVGFVALMVASGWSGCMERRSGRATPCTSVTSFYFSFVPPGTQLDVLFVIDNSESMRDEQSALLEQLPRLVNILASGDVDQDGDGPGDDEYPDPDFFPTDTVRVGVVTTDMGSGGFDVPTCARSDFGDDGVLRTQGRTDLPGCVASYPPFLTFEPWSPDRASLEAFARDVTCLAAVGTDGCRFEQPLEAMLKALSPTLDPGVDYVEPIFFGNTRGHADGPNEGFGSDASVLAIIPITDEDDCSVRDPNLLDPSGPYSATSPRLRCSAHADRLQPVARFVEHLVRLPRRGRLVYAPIVGIPLDLVPERGLQPDWETLISEDLEVRDDRLEARVDPASPGRLLPSCSAPGRVAYPPIRLLQVAQRLQEAGATVTVQSICQPSFEDALTGMINLLRRALWTICSPRLVPGPDGRVPCQLLMDLPEGTTCADIDGAEPSPEPGFDCVLHQLVPTDRTPGAMPDGDGWYYDGFTPDRRWGCVQSIRFTARPPGAGVALSCLTPVAPPWVSEASRCEPGLEDCRWSAPAGATMACDPRTRTCGLPCEGGADCREAGLVDFVCDGRPLSEVDPVNFAGVSDRYGFCVNPACGS